MDSGPSALSNGLSTRYDAIVVGGGHSGLVTSWYLADAGFSVLVLERREQVGGGCVTEEIFPGFRGNSVAVAPHSLDPRVTSDMRLADFGLSFIQSDPGTVHLFPDGRAMFQWSDSSARRESMLQFASERDLEGFRALQARLRSVAEQARVSFYDEAPSFGEVASRFVSAEDRRMFELIMFGSVVDLLDEYIGSDDLKAFIAQTAMATNLVGPWTPGGAYFLLQRPLYEASLRSIGHANNDQMLFANSFPKGGIGAVTQAMARSNESVGVKIITSAAVTEILVTDGRVTGVALEDGREFRTSYVVSNVSPKTTLTQLLDPTVLDPEFLARARKLNVQGSMGKVHLALGGDPIFRAANNDGENAALLGAKFRVIPPLESLQECYNEARLGRWSHNTSVNGVFSAPDPSLTPDGCHFLGVTVRNLPYNLESGDWDVERDSVCKAVITTLKEYITNLDDILLDAHAYTPLDLERRFGMVEGNPAHMDIVPGQIFNSRPMPECADNRTPIQGLYMCGVGIWPANYISGVTGYNAAIRLLTDNESQSGGSERARAPIGASAEP